MKKIIVNKRIRIAPKKRKAYKYAPVIQFLRALGFAATFIFTIIFTYQRARPVYSSKAPLIQQLVANSPTKGPPPLDRLLKSPEYQRDRIAFAADLVRTGRMSQSRADSIAGIAVREAYLRQVSPALIFGVMLTENARFISGAQSNVGAIGLMQIYPKVWLRVLGDSLGTNLGVDSTNLRYGVNILNRYLYPRNKDGSRRERDYRTALLRYNGCVKGTNTKNCFNYPDKVQTFVEKDAIAICAGRSFYDCIAKPFLAGLLGDTLKYNQ